MRAFAPTLRELRELRELRHAVGLTQAELAARSTVSVRTIQGLETGAVTRPRRATLELLTTTLVTALTDQAGPPVRVVQPYADRVPTDQSRTDAAAVAAAAAVPPAYAFPSADLALAPTADSRALFWLERTDPAIVIAPDGPRSEPRFNLCRALPLRVQDEPRWVITVLARDVQPSDGVGIVDALRAFRAGAPSREVAP